MSGQPLLLAGGRLVDPEAGTEGRGGVLVLDGLIADVGPALRRDTAPADAEVIDCTGLVVAPGLVDLRAATGEPGGEHRETLATASLAAAAGGVTTLLASPETDPAVDDPAVVDFVLRRARDTACVRVLPMAALTRGLAGREMTELGLLQEAGAVAFTDGARSLSDARLFRSLLSYARDFGATVVHHTEEPSLATGVMNEGEFASRLGLPGRPAAAEAMMLERDLRLVALTGGRYHAAALTCADSLAVLRRAREAGLPVTASTTINHLTLNENDVGAYRTFCKVSPPLRREDDRLALVEAVREGLIDAVVSDHNPQDVETKRLPFAECADGAVGLETLLPAGLRLVHDGSMSLPALLAALSSRPARALGLAGGRLRRGEPADLVVFDPDEPFVLDPATLHSRCKNTPFDGARLQGRVKRTLVAGRTVYEA